VKISVGAIATAIASSVTSLILGISNYHREKTRRMEDELDEANEVYGELFMFLQRDKHLLAGSRLRRVSYWRFGRSVGIRQEQGIALQRHLAEKISVELAIRFGDYLERPSETTRVELERWVKVGLGKRRQKNWFRRNFSTVLLTATIAFGMLTVFLAVAAYALVLLLKPPSGSAIAPMPTASHDTHTPGAGNSASPAPYRPRSRREASNRTSSVRTPKVRHESPSTTPQLNISTCTSCGTKRTAAAPSATSEIHQVTHLTATLPSDLINPADRLIKQLLPSPEGALGASAQLAIPVP
jgi:hypothetical protein